MSANIINGTPKVKLNYSNDQIKTKWYTSKMQSLPDEKPVTLFKMLSTKNISPLIS